VPYIATAGESKTKPTQHSVKELRSIGLQPDILVVRSDHAIPADARQKIALFTNVEVSAVIPLVDARSIYGIPLVLHDMHMDDIVLRKFGLDCPPADLSDWKRVVEREMNPERSVRLVMVGKYMKLLDAYKSLNEAIVHAGIHTRTRVEVTWLDAEDVERRGGAALEDADAILVPGGFGGRGFEGMVRAARYARENGVPYLGICYGLHAAVVDYARNVAGLSDANTTENERNSPHPVIALVTEWTDEKGRVETRNESSALGGTMRTGEQLCMLRQGSRALDIYGERVIRERHRHRWEVNESYVGRLEAAGMSMTGRSPDDLVEVVEIPEHPWFLACQFHPEFTSTPREGHPLFSAFIRAAVEHSAAGA
jgi:CTP synthase